MIDVTSALRNTVPISMFNRGLAGKIFEDVKQNGSKVVMKNNAPECVLLSPKEYLRLVDEVNDTRLAMIAAERMQNFQPQNIVSAQTVFEKNGITEQELEGFDEVEFE